MGNIQNKDVEFLSSYWKSLNEICDKFDKEIRLKPTGKAVGNGLMRIINYSDLGETWDVGRHVNGTSKAFNIFIAKLRHMIMKGDSVNIKPMINAICTGRIKTFKFKDKNGNTVNCGSGHFRFGSALKLTKEELEFLRKYFNYND